MKKRLIVISCLLVAVMCLTAFAACVSSSMDDDTLNVELTKLKNDYNGKAVSGSLPGELLTTDAKGNETTIYVKWQVTDTTLVSIKSRDEDGRCALVLSTTDPITFTAKATLTNAKGTAYTDSNKQPYSVTVSLTANGATSGGNQGGNGGTGTGGDSTGGDSTGGTGGSGDNTGGNQGGGGTGGVGVTLSLVGTSTRTSYSTSQIVHSANGVTYTNDKASATSNCYDIQNDTWGTRAYKGSTVKIEYTSAMTRIVITLDSGTYSGTQYMSGFDGMTVDGATITRDNDTVTIVFDTPSTSFQSAVLASQCRILSVTVYTD